MSNSKVAVIGGAGFIGTNLCQLLEDHQEEYSIIDKAPSSQFADKVRLANILDADKFADALEGAEVIVNLAAEHKDDVRPVSLYYDVNVTGAKEVCRLAESQGINKIVFTSSVAVYGLNKPNPNEEFETDPFNHYGKSKLEAEQVYIDWYQQDPDNRCLVIIRPTVVFGKNNRGNVYNLLRQIASKRFLRIGKGENKKSMVYVENMASFIHFCLNRYNSGHHVFNYVDTPDLTMNQLLSECEQSLGTKISPVRVPYFLGLLGGYCFDIISRLTGKSLPVSSVRIKKFCATTQFNASKAHSSDFQAPYTLSEGLDITLKSEFGNSH